MTFRTAVYETRTYGGVRGAPCYREMAGPSTRLYDVLYSVSNLLKIAIKSLTNHNSFSNLNDSLPFLSKI